MQTSPSLRKWEIWWADVEFEDMPGVRKIRPVLVWETGMIPIVSVLKLTTHSPRSEFPGEYEIIEYQKAGLKKKTIVRCSRLIDINIQFFHSRIGRLQPIDIFNINNIANTLW